MDALKTASAIDMDGFAFAYPDHFQVFDPVDWHVAKGSFTLLVGATGSGKTTLLRSLKPEIAPVGRQTGSIAVGGRPLDAWTARESAAGIGYVAQSPENQIVCDTVWHELAFGLENLGVAPDAMRRRVAEVAHFFGIEPWMRRATADLSGGQKQMVNLAGVLVMQPKLLLLDEPTVQLDPVAEKNFLHALFRINREIGLTVVVATHAPEVMVDYATDCFEIGPGGIAEVALARFATRGEESFEARPGPRPVKGDAPRTVIEVRDVYFRYAKEADWVLRGIDIAVGRGNVHALVGGNGSGKSTLLRLGAGSLSQERGSVHNGLADRQALLPQDPRALFVCDSVVEELREWQRRCGYDDDAVARIAHRFGLSDMLDRHPYDLSGGQQQKLALAKVLLTDPDLLLLDEPTKGLDARSKCDAAETLIALAHEGKTIVLVTHDLAFVSRVADTVSMLFDGQVACTEPVGDFFAGNLFYRPEPDGFTRLFSGRHDAVVPENGTGVSGNSVGRGTDVSCCGGRRGEAGAS